MNNQQLYKGRDPRDYVMQKVLEDLDFAATWCSKASKSIAVRQGLDGGIHTGKLRGVPCHFFGDAGVAQRDLFQHRTRHTGKMLLHTADAGAASAPAKGFS